MDPIILADYFVSFLPVLMRRVEHWALTILSSKSLPISLLCLFFFFCFLFLSLVKISTLPLFSQGKLFRKSKSSHNFRSFPCLVANSKINTNNLPHRRSLHKEECKDYTTKLVVDFVEGYLCFHLFGFSYQEGFLLFHLGLLLRDLISLCSSHK